jgi:hypothetical protein
MDGLVILDRTYERRMAHVSISNFHNFDFEGKQNRSTLSGISDTPTLDNRYTLILHCTIGKYPNIVRF